MKSLIATSRWVCLLAAAFSCPSQAQTTSVQDASKSRIMRGGSQPTPQGPADPFTGSVHIDSPVGK